MASFPTWFPSEVMYCAIASTEEAVLIEVPCRPVITANISTRHGRSEISQSYTIPIQDLASERVRVKYPLDVRLTIEDDHVLAAFEEAEIVASGDNIVDAMEQVKSAISSTYFINLKHSDKLGPLPRRQLLVLDRYLEQIPVI